MHILKHGISFYFQLRNNTDTILRMQAVLKTMPLLLPSVVYTMELVETEETKGQDYQGNCKKNKYIKHFGLEMYLVLRNSCSQFL